MAECDVRRRERWGGRGVPPCRPEDKATTARAPELLAELDENYVAELQRCVVETNTLVVDSLEGLRDEIVRHRKVLVETATELGIGVVAAGAVPLSVPAEMR